MPVDIDRDPRFADYANPERLVSTAWVEEHLGDEGLVVLESDEDVLLYEVGHVPGALKLDWHVDLNDAVTRDFVDGEGWSKVMRERGINRDDTLVIYGDKSNWWAAYALWVATLFGHRDVRLMDGGRDAWIAEGRPLTTEKPEVTPSDYPAVERDDRTFRAYRDDVTAHLGNPLVDVRSPEEYTGVRTTAPAYPEEGALRAGHIPTAQSVPWGKAVGDDGRYRSRAELEALYLEGAGVERDGDVVVYCRIGERSSHTWFALHHLLGVENARNYDGSWTEWGSLVGVPVVRGEEPGEVPA